MSDDEPIVIGEKKSIESGVLKENRDLIIAEPPAYRINTQEKYPVLYLLDGSNNIHHTTAAVNILPRMSGYPIGWGLADPMPLYNQGGVDAVKGYFKPIRDRLGFERNMPLMTLAMLCFASHSRI